LLPHVCFQHIVLFRTSWSCNFCLGNKWMHLWMLPVLVIHLFCLAESVCVIAMDWRILCNILMIICTLHNVIKWRNVIFLLVLHAVCT
jgi:hypothetical protein